MQSEAKEFLFAEFQDEQPVEFLRTGTFADAMGSEVDITEDLLDALVANFEAGEARQDVPIDVDHERGEAAGWVERVWKEGDKLLAAVRWNELGAELVEGEVYRYLSATIDMGRKLLKSISLVNFPAVKGLRPVQLSEGWVTVGYQPGFIERVVEAVRGVFLSEEEVGIEVDEKQGMGVGSESDDKEDVNMADEKDVREEIRAELREEVRAEEETRLAEMKAEARAEVEAELKAEMEREKELVEFAEGVCEGEVGLSTRPDDLVELMETMDEEQLASFKEVIEAKVVDFTEHGSSRKGNVELTELPSGYKRMLETWTDAGHPLKEWFEIQSDIVGDMDQYDLSEFVDEE